MRHRTTLLLAVFLLIPSSQSFGGTFHVVDIYYSYDPPTPITVHGRVAATARYEGLPDNNDLHALLQTTACQILNKQVEVCEGGAGLGFNATNGPWLPGYTIFCNTSACMGHRYISRPCCGQQTIDFQGKAGVTIYHQFSPEIHLLTGHVSSVSCKQCSGNCAGGGGPAERAYVLPIRGTRNLQTDALDRVVSDFLLTRIDRQGEMSYLMDEWALLSSDYPPGEFGAVTAYSSTDLAAWLLAQSQSTPNNSLVVPESASSAPWNAVVVMVPKHPNRMRAIPLPVAVLGSSWLPGAHEPGVVAVRGDFSEDRNLEQLDILFEDRVLSDVERKFLWDNLRLRYRSTKSHRTILYAVIRFDRNVQIESSVTLLPECCGGPPQFPPWPV